MFARLAQPADRAAGRLYDALAAPARSERTVLIALAVYTLAWTVYATVAKSSQGLHYDMVEVIAWSRDLDFGFFKHPPLAAALVRVWFTVFPVAEWSYYLLAMLMPSIALWIVWRLSADYLSIQKRVAGLALLTLVPFFNFHALKFNVNTVLIPLWATTTFWFLRSYKTRSALYAALAGVGAAACMLGKYWSIFLLAGLVLATLIDSRRARYFKSPAPWITVLVGLIVLAPHLVWLVQNDFAPFRYAVIVHGDKSFWTTASAALGYLVGSAGYAAIPTIIVLIAARPDRAVIADMMWPSDTERRLAAAAFWGSLVLPAFGAVASGTEINSLWSMAAWTLLPVLLLSSPAVTLRPVDTRGILIAAVVVPLIMLIASPVIAILGQRSDSAPSSAYAHALSERVQQAWMEATGRPLRLVDGDAGLAYDVIAYAGRAVQALPGLPPKPAAQIARDGLAFVCAANDRGCAVEAARRVGDAKAGKTDIEISPTRWGRALPPQRYSIFVVPPRS